MSDPKNISKQVLPPIQLPDLDSISALQQYLQTMLQKTLEIQSQNFSCFRSMSSQKKLLQMRENSLVKLKLKQLAFSRTSTDLSTGQSSTNNTSIRTKPDLSTFENSAFKKRKIGSESSGIIEHLSLERSVSADNSPNHNITYPGNLSLKINSKIMSDDSTYSFGNVSDAPTKASDNNSETGSPIRNSPMNMICGEKNE
jgi:hypothetical protein